MWIIAFLLFLLSVFHSFQITISIPLLKLTTSESLISELNQSQNPLEYFQVTKPINTPKSKPCSTFILSHNFSNTYSSPPVAASYSPPVCLRRRLRHGRIPSLAVLRWSATCRGRQFDRIFGVWLSKVELLRSCTAEPTASGIVWNVEKDITKYSSLLIKDQTLEVYLGNIVDSTYTGVYNVNVSMHFWFDEVRVNKTRNEYDLPADLILPVTRNSHVQGGNWFEIQNATDVQYKEIAIPRNAYRAILEVYVSFHQNDEFWYGNPPNEYIEKSNITGLAGNGAFREVVVSLDEIVVGSVWPFTVVYTGGVNPLLWRPITGIGSYDLPTYDVEITPFLGKLLDGKMHRFGFGVTNGLDIWYVDANLHLWLDGKSSEIHGELMKHGVSELKPRLVSKYQGLDGNFDTFATREITSSGWVKSSYGNITTNFFQSFDYKNLMEFRGNGSIQVVNQTINCNYGSYAKHSSSVLHAEQVFLNFPLYLYTATSDQVNDNYTSLSNISLGFNKKKLSGGKFGFFYSKLKDSQNGQGIMRIKGNLVKSGLGSNQQVYRYESSDECYFRNVSSYNYTILHDESSYDCSMGLGSFFTR